MRMLRPFGAALIAVSVVLAATVSGAVPAEAGPKLRFTKLYADSPGSDRGSNNSRNGEYVVLKNVGTSQATLGGYRIKDRAGHRYTFPSGYALKRGASVTLHTGNGRNRAGHRYWAEDGYVWNNTGDTATLVSRTGNRIDSCVYKPVPRGYATC